MVGMDLMKQLVIDFHTHSLPGIDDGSRSLQETLKLLTRQYQEGILHMVATPHFYPDDDLSSFITKRQAAYTLVRDALDADDALKDITIYQGAEVLLSVDTWQLPDVHKLCIEGTCYMLVELPYTKWTDWVYQSVEKLISARGIMPILAHVERYQDVIDNPNCLIRLLEMGALCQMNSYNLDPKAKRYKQAKKLINKHFIHLLGSDIHREGRFFSIKNAYEVLEKTGSVNRVNEMIENGQKVLANERFVPQAYVPFKSFFCKWY